MAEKAGLEVSGGRLEDVDVRLEDAAENRAEEHPELTVMSEVAASPALVSDPDPPPPKRKRKSPKPSPRAKVSPRQRFLILASSRSGS